MLCKGSLERAFAKMVDTAVEPAKASHMVYDVWFDEEDSYRPSRERCKFKRGTQVEAKWAKECLHVAYMGASLPVSKRKYYPGSNHGRHWGNPLYANFLKGDGQSGNPPGSSTAGGSKTQGKAKTSGKRKCDPEPDDGAVTDDASGDGKESCDNESSAPPSEGEP